MTQSLIVWKLFGALLLISSALMLMIIIFGSFPFQESMNKIKIINYESGDSSNNLVNSINRDKRSIENSLDTKINSKKLYKYKVGKRKSMKGPKISRKARDISFNDDPDINSFLKMSQNDGDLQPLEINYKLLKSSIRNKRAEIELDPLENAYERCKKQTTQSRSCFSQFIKMYKLASEMHKKAIEMRRLLKGTDRFDSISSDEWNWRRKFNLQDNFNENHHQHEENFEVDLEKLMKNFFEKYSQNKEIFKTQNNGTKDLIAATREDSPTKISMLEKFDLSTAPSTITTNAPTTTSTITTTTTSTTDKTTTTSAAQTTMKKQSTATTEALKQIIQPVRTIEVDNFDQIIVQSSNPEQIDRETENDVAPIEINSYTNPPHIHEDLVGDSQRAWENFNFEGLSDKMSLVEKWNKKNLKSQTPQYHEENVDEEISSKLKNLQNDPVTPSPFSSLCKQLNRQQESTVKAPTTTTSDKNGFSFQPTNQFTNSGFMPVTSEAMKASAQFMLNPNFGISMPQTPMPICFYPNPSMNMPMFGNYPGNFSPFFMNSRFNYGSFVPNMGAFGNMPQGFSVAPFGHSSTASGLQNGFNNHNFMPSSQPVFCTLMANAQRGQFGSNTRLRDSSQNETESNLYPNIPSANDIIYASFTNQIVARTTMTDSKDHCNDPDSMACFSSHECIAKSKWCDSYVDCLDGSDETSCSCKSRLDKSRICDGYSDCPMGEDEIGCFGCDKLMFSCYNNQQEYIKANRSTISMCYSFVNKCDGFDNCLNGNDERDCNIIINNLGNPLAQSYTEGFLYRNHKGKWFPVCGNAEKWAKEACDSESDGETDKKPIITVVKQKFPGPFIATNQQDLLENCKHLGDDVVVHVKCPEMQCGRPRIVENKKYRLFKRQSIANNDTDARHKREDETRVVGGDYCKPMEWPFVVALYRNGKFHCGGVIYDENWIITAAHCVINYQKYHYEIRAGLFRQSSYSATVQIAQIDYIVVHKDYDRYKMRNDIALMKLDEPLKYNRWLKPVCMPEQKRITDVHKNNWKLNGPKYGTICTAVGWGAIRENGPGSDQLKQVKIPIMESCKNENDKISNDICAGEPAGGRDACQGDSGGPLFCRSTSDENEWYLAGIISHGQGCARPGEPGVYTRVAMHIDWMKSIMNTKNLPSTKPLTECPGFRCFWGGVKCIEGKKRCNRIVDCLGGEDEVSCNYNIVPDVASIAKNSTNSVEDEHSIKFTIPMNKFEIPTTEAWSTTTIPTKTTTPESTTENPFQFFNGKSTKTEKCEATFGVKSTPEPPSTATKSPLDWQKFIQIFKTSTSPSEIEIRNNATETSTQKNRNDDNGPLKNLDENIPKSDGEIHKRGNATMQNSGLMPPNRKWKTLQIQQIPNRFTCSRIPQKIDISHKCDRIVDCEDGTDEENCKCRDYLKGSLSLLICDGKADCEDLTDEENCGFCTGTEFVCPLSKHCIQASRRCDGNIDCEFKEDEADCFALTDGQQVYLDVNKRPKLMNNGYLSRNKQGTWNIMCAENDFNTTDLDGINRICLLLGFKGYQYFNFTKYSQEDKLPFIMNNDDEVQINRNQKYSHLAISEKIFRSNNDETENCQALYIQCHQLTNAEEPINIKPTIIKDLKKPETLKPIIKLDQKPIVVLKPNISSLIELNTKQPVIIKDLLKPIIDVPRKLPPKLEANTKIHHYPWSVDIYNNGQLICNGVLLNMNWIVIQDKCLRKFRFDNDFVVALLGGGKTTYQARGPNEQIRRIDCIQKVSNSNILLLHLEYPVTLTRYVLPTFLEDINDIDHHNNSIVSKCMTITHDHSGLIKTFAVKNTIDKASCSSRYDESAGKQIIGNRTLCFESVRSESDDNLIIDIRSMLCDSETNSKEEKHGIIICHDDKGTGWYPKSFFSYNIKSCEFNKPFLVESFANCHKEIYEIIGNSQCVYPQQPAAICPSLFRCPLGNCLSSHQICDGMVDCHDGSDESSYMCSISKQNCPSSNFKCLNGKCIPKSKFCNHINDCGDLTDEPTVCSCFTYLQATDPSRICDGIRNCWDKSDESPAFCDCKPDSFKCSSSNECIPNGFVCDNQPDCTNGEDEKFCLGIEFPAIPYISSDGFGQIIEQSYGIWHTKCFAKNSLPNENDLINMCHKLGYDRVSPKYRFIEGTIKVDNQTLSRSDSETSTTSEKYLTSTKAIIVNQFSRLKLNDQVNILIKPSRPIAELSKWDETDLTNCYRLEIKCV